ncbi:MAG: hypothetical protein CMI18_14100 [Opitutaceae bacterium]|nr:hypothetical protein [Opitutaceae bacterium]
MQPPRLIQAIGDEIAISWDEGVESYYQMDFLRANSPSAENMGETDILGNRHGGDGPSEFPGVKVTGWEFIGNYAIRFRFSDGHSTGLYSWDYLKQIEPK